MVTIYPYLLNFNLRSNSCWYLSWFFKSIHSADVYHSIFQPSHSGSISKKFTITGKAASFSEISSEYEKNVTEYGCTVWLNLQTSSIFSTFSPHHARILAISWCLTCGVSLRPYNVTGEGKCVELARITSFRVALA